MSGPFRRPGKPAATRTAPSGTCSSEAVRRAAHEEGDGMAHPEEALHEFVAGRRAALFRSAFLLCGDRDEAEDLVQSTLVKVILGWRRLQRLDNVEAYARRTLVNTFIASRRRLWRREHAYGELPETGPDGGRRRDRRRGTGRAGPAAGQAAGGARAAVPGGPQRRVHRRTARHERRRGHDRGGRAEPAAGRGGGGPGTARAGRRRGLRPRRDGAPTTPPRRVHPTLGRTSWPCRR